MSNHPFVVYGFVGRRWQEIALAKRRRRSDLNKKKTEQTALTYSSVDEAPNSNVSYPYGLIRTIKHYLQLIGLTRYLKSLKRTGPRLDLIVVALCAYTLHATNSMDACSRWLEDPRIKRSLGFRYDDIVSQKTIQRAVEKLGEHREDILQHLYQGILSRFEIDDYDIIMDGSAVVMHGPKSALAALGYPRDGRACDLQVQFMVAILSQLGIPVYIKPYIGNASDEAQYADAMPEIKALVSDKKFQSLEAYKDKGVELSALATLAKAATTIIADNGAASKENAERAEKLGFDRLTRVKINASDEKDIREHLEDFKLIVDEGVMCYTKHYKSSDRTTFLFCSPDLLLRSVKSATSSVRRGAAVYNDLKENGIRSSKVIKVRKIPGVDVTFGIVLNDPWLPFSERQINILGREKAGPRAGFFKLESSCEMTPEEAIRKYRHRAIVEQTISSLKRVTGIKPLRVWSDKSVTGSMVLALLAEAAVSMARYCLGKHHRPVDPRSGRRQEAHTPSTATMARELSHLTLTRYRGSEGPWDSQLSNWTPLCEAVFEDIHLHEAPEWGDSKVPLTA